MRNGSTDSHYSATWVAVPGESDFDNSNVLSFPFLRFPTPPISSKLTLTNLRLGKDVRILRF